ncbi:MAG: phosphoribosylformylglycinamidine synthase subunit PurL [Capsulimonadales bacterium]|nr:phosphoribosylformylglycinamidine synthase subunit PurL [Capsulimonadales bacterium]
MPIDPAVYREMGLNDSEYQLILDVLQREPSYTEIGMYSVMWSEHCGYKYSRPVLKAFAEYKKAQESGALENAGVVPLGDTGYGVVFKMESHNHPSAVEPFEGAATGVGGILRDIFTMGARPVAILDSLRFGPITGDSPAVTRNKYLLNGVVSGISHYTNCVGVPNAGGEIYFHPCYNGNPLVNAMAVGVVRTDRIASARAKGVGNGVLYVGSATGRDGIHGATFASVELTEESEAKRPNVQVGDPFLEKLLIEATLEALETGHIVAIQDMGAAGLTCGTCEMSAKGGLGMEIDVQRVPRREAGMTAYEIMLSESQERMLAVVAQGHEEEVAAVFRKWGLNAAYIGVTTDTGRVIVRDGDRIEADVPAKSLADDCPTYYLEAAEPEYIAAVRNVDLSGLPEPDSYGDTLLTLLSTPTIASKRWVWEQYDTMVRTETEVLPGRADACVLAIREAGGRRIAVTTDCNPRFCYLDPYVGAQIAIAEAARNLSCVGAVPKAVTDCLNFPSPERPAGFWQFRRAVEGMAAACEFFRTPVVSGNVSFYNETPEVAIYPTPTVGMVGVFEEGVTPCDLAFKEDGDLIYLLRPAGSENVHGLDGSEYVSVLHGKDVGNPVLDMDGEARVQQVVRAAIAGGHLKSAHDCSEGGLAVAVAESCLGGNRGAEIRIAIADFGSQSWSAILFGEAFSRVLVTVREGGTAQEALLDLAENAGIEAIFLGQVKANDRLDAAGMFDLPLSVLRDAYEGAIPRAMGEK